MWVKFPISVVALIQDRLVLTKLGVTRVDLVINIMLQDSSFSVCLHKPVWIYIGTHCLIFWVYNWYGARLQSSLDNLLLPFQCRSRLWVKESMNKIGRYKSLVNTWLLHLSFFIYFKITVHNTNSSNFGVDQHVGYSSLSYWNTSCTGAFDILVYLFIL